MKDQGDWLRQMAQWQQQYWDGWRGMAAQGMGSPQAAAATAAWPDDLNAWQRGLAGMAPAAGFGAGGQGELVERMLSYGKQYLSLLQGLMSGQGFPAGAMQFDPQAWIGELRELQSRYGPGLAAAMPADTVPWFGGVDPAQIEQMVRAFTAAPLRGVQQEMHGWLSTPAFGLAREHAERRQALMRAWLDYQVANQRYSELMLRSLTRTVDTLESKLAERDEPGRRIESARALYDLWIDAAEEAYAELALSVEFREIYGELVNSQMRVRAGLNAEIERFGAQFGMPTRTEVDSIARQLHELKREFRRAGNSAAPAAKRRDQDERTAAEVDAGPGKSTVKAERKPVRPARAGAKDKQGPAKSGASRKRGSAKRAAEPPTVKARADETGGGRNTSSRRGAQPPVLKSTARKRSKGV